MPGGGQYIRRELGVRSEPSQVYAAYESARADGDVRPLVVGLLPLVVSVVNKRAASLDEYMSDELLSEIIMYLMDYAPALVEKTFDSGEQIIRYVNVRVRYEATRKYPASFTETFETTTNPVQTSCDSPDYLYQQGERHAFLRRFARKNLRLTGVLRNHALRVIAKGVGSLDGLTSRENARFIGDYLKVQARLGDRAYHGDS